MKDIDLIVLLVATLLFLLSMLWLYLRRKDIIAKLPKTHIFGYHVMYTDQKVDINKRRKNVEYSKLLYSEKYDIQGKPDYIFQKNFGKLLVPVEIKSGSVKDEPHYGDLMQLAAYFIIIEDIYAIRPKQGRLVYRNKMFIVRNTKKIRQSVLTVIDEMRNMMAVGKSEADPSFVKCRYCLCRGTVCEYCDE